MIRLATPHDFDAMIVLGRMMHAEGWYSFHPFDEAKIRDVLQLMVNKEFAIVHETDGEIDGLFLGMTSELWICRDLTAHDLAVFVRKDRRGGTIAFRMIASFLDWAHEKGATEVTISSSCGVEKTSMERLMSSTGFMHVGGVFKRKGGRYV